MNKDAVKIITGIGVVGCTFMAGVGLTALKIGRDLTKHQAKMKEYDMEIYNGLKSIVDILDKHDCKNESEES